MVKQNWKWNQEQGKNRRHHKANMINANTLAVLMGTTCSRASEKKEFEPCDHVDTVYTAPDTTVKVPFMQLNKKNHFSVFVDNERDFKVVSVPYKDEMEMTLVVPPLGQLSSFEVSIQFLISSSKIWNKLFIFF